ncbi:MAG: hypothetical protein L0206_07730 [Actinobacteria bacterium]|nr:hypothetical protein [Actinomycetota bacterium]
MNGGTSPSDREGFPAEFDRIDAAVDAGATDLRALGFWRLLAQVKTDPALAAHWADQAGRIDRKAFERRIRIRFPVWLGNLVLALGIVAGGIAIGVALTTDSETVAGLALVFAALAWSAAVHSPTHWLVGRAIGLRFIAYFFATFFPPVPGLKIDYATYLRASPTARAWMHASGAIASKVAPLAALAFWPATIAPTWAGWVLVGYGALLIATDVFISTKRSDWKRVRRELRVARRQSLAG